MNTTTASPAALRFSEHFGITTDPLTDDWFDTVLVTDTPLFIDPFLIFDNPHAEFENAHETIIGFFNALFESLARSQTPRSMHEKKVLSALSFPEVKSLCLGYTQSGTAGAGTSDGVGSEIFDAMKQALRLGLTNIDHFEEICILRKGIGPDRISDAVGNILKKELCKYTESIAKRHGIPTRRILIEQAYFDIEAMRWKQVSAELPINPYTDEPILLIPARFLRTIQSISSDEFFRFLKEKYPSGTDSDIRSDYIGSVSDDLSYEISRGINKSKLAEIARTHPELRKEFIQQVKERGSNEYDLNRDPRGLVKWTNAAQDFVKKHPADMPSPNTPEELYNFAIYLCDQFKYFVESQGYKLLWNDFQGSGTRREKSEEAAQKLFFGVTFLYARSLDIEITPEGDLGRGPVDFIVNKGSRAKVLIETKKANNTKWRQGIEIQLPTYLKSSQAKFGIYVVIVFSEKDDSRLTEIEDISRKVSEKLKVELRVISVDATPDKPSASKATDIE